jgi:hypothetical protein
MGVLSVDDVLVLTEELFLGGVSGNGTAAAAANEADKEAMVNGTGDLRQG